MGFFIWKEKEENKHQIQRDKIDLMT